MRSAIRSVRRLFVCSILTIAACLLAHIPARGQEADTAETTESETAAPDEAAATQGVISLEQAQEAAKQAEEAMSQKDYEKALAAYATLLQFGGQNQYSQGGQIAILAAYTGRGRALVGMKDYEAALEEFKRALDISPEFAPALVARGEMYLEVNQAESALADFQAAVKANRGDLAAQFGLGKSLVLLGGYQQAIGPLTRVLTATPDNAEALRLRGTANAGVFKMNEAVADIQESINLNPDDHESYFSLAIVYLRNEDYEAAAEELGKAIEHYKPKPDEEYQPYTQGYLTRSSVFVEVGKAAKDEAAKKAAYQAAIDEAQKLLDQLDEKIPYTAAARAAALHGRGVGERMLGEVGKAIETFSQAIELNPDLGETYFRRGICFHLLGEDQMAILDFVESANINYDDPRANLWEGFMFAKLGNYHEAVRAYGNAIAASDRYTPAYINRALAYQALGEHEKAIKDFEAAIRLEPANAEYYFKRGLAHMRTGDAQKASESFASAIEFDNKHAAAHRHMAAALQSLGNNDLANEYRKKASELAPPQNTQ